MAGALTGPPPRRRPRALAAAATAGSLLLAGCSAPKNDPPPKPIQGSLPDNLQTCDDLIDEGTLDDGNVFVGGRRAACPSVGQKCPLLGIDAFESACGAGEAPFAVCVADRWQLQCADQASPLDAGGD